MPGKILVIDDLATNRIILKVKLAEAYYDVSQAASVPAALAQMRVARPDLILLFVRDVDIAGLRQTIGRLRQRDPAPWAMPIVVLLDSQAPPDRIAALTAGADEVISRPFEELHFLARLRRLMREQLSDQDLRQHMLTAPTLGFADAQAAFQGAGQIGLLAPDRKAARKLQDRLASHLSHTLREMSPEDVMGATERAPSLLGAQGWDLFIMHFDGRDVQAGLRQFSALRANNATRTCPVIALVEPEATEITCQLLDLGAGDVMLTGTDPQEIAVRLGKQIARKRLRDQMRNSLTDGLKAAVIDPLTGLYNRRYALSYLNCLMQEREGETADFAVLIADLDYFKQINDTYGHTGGDAVLVQVAKLLRAHLRKSDMVARIGGEEFLIVVPDCTQDAARRIATNICGKVRDMPILLPGHATPAHLTISIGLTLADSQSGPPEAIIERADRALYRSKAEGRDTVRFADLSAA